jgi:hypothetical protein
MHVKVFQIHKRSSYEFKNIQDKYSINLSDNLFALADGTTQSLNSEIWASLICENFTNKNPTFIPIDFIQSAIQNVEKFKEIKYEFSTNPAKASLEREKLKKGATTTFIGANIDSSGILNIISVGDSNIFILRDKNVIKYPFNTIDELDSNNFFLNTEKLIANEVEETFFNTKKNQLINNDIVILATDALSRLFIKIPSKLNDFISLKDFDGFRDFCVSNWENKILEEDDITGIIIVNTSIQSNFKEYLPPLNFSFPKEEETDFTPSINNEIIFESQIKHSDMQQIFNYLNSINIEVVKLRKKAILNQILLYCLVGFSIINIIFMITLNLRNIPKKQIETNNKSEVSSKIRNQKTSQSSNKTDKHDNKTNNN